jgi:alpha-galactosidase/6-phospho-beta-glucosidase family protein
MNPSNKNVLVYFILLLWLFVLLFFTQEYFNAYQINKTELWELKEEDDKLSSQIKSLENDKKNLSQKSGKWPKIHWENVTKQMLDKYIVNFTENNFIEYFYSIWENFKIEKLSLDKWTLDKNGFMKWKIELWVAFETEEEMKEFLTKLISDDSKYRFYIDKFTFPIGKMWSWENTKINISLIIYYKEKTINNIKKVLKK